MEQACALQLKQITKRFGTVLANNNIDLTLYRGEILCLLGENGSGKTTLMNMVAGIYRPDAGEIFVGGAAAAIHSPHDAFQYGIGMVHQHFKLVDVFTAAENIILGSNKRLNRKQHSQRIGDICRQYGFAIDLEQRVCDMSVSQKQTTEIVKALYRGADILILDEPTAVLPPQEAEKLFAVLRKMRDDGNAIILITHKLREVLAVSDRVAVLRKGENAGCVNTCDATQQSLTGMMMGHTVSLQIDRPAPVQPSPRIIVQNLSVQDKTGTYKLSDVSFTAYGGEILGIAGISNCGQKELLESIAGLQLPETNSKILYVGAHGETQSMLGLNAPERRKRGIRLSFVPEDRLGMGLVGNMDLAQNMMLHSYRAKKGPFTDRKSPRRLAERLVSELDISTPSVTTPIRRLSGGNVQKLLVGREIAAAPAILLTAYATRGLDVRTAHSIYRLLNEQKKNGAAVLYAGEDLDVLLQLCDRILVLCDGKVAGIADGRTATRQELGRLMTGHCAEEGRYESQ